jgi:propionyl-CoA carboxylase beta chain
VTTDDRLRIRETGDAVGALRRRHQEKRRREETAGERRHGQGRGTARERIDMLLDPGSFIEVGALVRHRSRDFGLDADRPLGDAVVTGHGLVHGRAVCVFAQDFTVFGGSVGEVAGEKIAKIMDLAMRARVPLIGINDSAGGRIQEGVVAQCVYGGILTRNVRMSGSVPQISLIMGPCAGGAVYSPALTDFVVMVDGSSHMFVTGPVLLREAIGEQVGLEELGGARTHNTVSGSAHHLAATEAEAIGHVRDLLAYLPSAGEHLVGPAGPDTCPADDELAAIIPDLRDAPYDMRAVLTRVLDRGELLESQRWFAPNIVVGFGRLDGRGVGVVANQPAVDGGRLDIDASEKAARFVRTCDAYDIPVLSFVDVPGFRPGVGQEWAGAARRCAKLLYAYAEASVPLLTVITRHAEGIGYVAMGSRPLGADLSLAWPTARIGGAEPYLAAERGLVDEVIEPAWTRKRLRRALHLLRAKQPDPPPPKKHENLPL